jgi:hypothetical protein
MPSAARYDMADPVDRDDDDDASEKWKHDDITERTPRQRRVEEIREISAQQAATYQTMKVLWDAILVRLQNPWRGE